MPANGGDDSNPGTSAAPFATIGAAIIAANTAITGGDKTAATISVAAGTYTEYNLTLSNPITIVGEGESRDDVIVQANASKRGTTGRRVFVISNADAAISGLTVRYGSWTTVGGNEGGNVLLTAGTITNCHVTAGYVIHTKDNGSYKGCLGGNIYMTDGLVVDSEISYGEIYNVNGAGGGNNIVQRGGRILRCEIHHGIRNGTAMNWVEESGGSGILMWGGVAENCYIHHNTYTYGTVCMRGAASLVNCTVYANSDCKTCNGVIVENTGANVVNCLIYGNGGTAALEWGNKNGSRFFYSAAPVAIANGTSCIDLSSYPDPYIETKDCRPQSSSPVVNAGSAEKYETYAISQTDYEGNERSVGVIDIGCYEAQPVFSVSFFADRHNVPLGEQVVFTAEPANPTGDITYSWDFGDGLDPTVTQETVCSYVYPSNGLFNVELTATCEGSDPVSVSYSWNMLVFPSDVYVNSANASPEYPYDTAEKAATSIADALIPLTIDGATAADGTTVHVAAGTYTETNVTITSAITIKGEGASRDDVIVQANASKRGTTGRRVFVISNADAAISGLTVRYGSWTTVGGNEGGNVLLTAGTITNCHVTAGYVIHTTDNGSYMGCLGGNIYMTGGLVVDSEISYGEIYNGLGAGGGSNIAQLGGRIQRCDIHHGMRNGTASGYVTQSGGSGILLWGGVAENCLIRQNSGTYGSVSLRGGSNSKLINCSVVGNSGNYSVNGVVVATTGAKIANCVIYDNGGTAASEWGNAYAACFYNCAFSADAEFSGGTSCVTDLTDAAFKDYAKGNYHPVANGALFNAGNTEAYTTYGAISATDLGGAARIVKKVIDIGCYETATSAGLQIYVR